MGLDEITGELDKLDIPWDTIIEQQGQYHLIAKFDWRTRVYFPALYQVVSHLCSSPKIFEHETTHRLLKVTAKLEETYLRLPMSQESALPGQAEEVETPNSIPINIQLVPRAF